jgi:PII-like signaling protein
MGPRLIQASSTSFSSAVSGATVLKGVAGFGADHHLHSASSVEISDRLPLKIEFIESAEKVENYSEPFKGCAVLA